MDHFVPKCLFSDRNAEKLEGFFNYDWGWVGQLKQFDNRPPKYFFNLVMQIIRFFYVLTLLTITLIAFYGYDKYQAISQNTRIPEAVLHLLTLAGVKIGAVAEQLQFWHKTKKLSFRTVFIMIIVVQIGLIVWWYLREKA